MVTATELLAAVLSSFDVSTSSTASKHEKFATVPGTWRAQSGPSVVIHGVHQADVVGAAAAAAAWTRTFQASNLALAFSWQLSFTQYDKAHSRGKMVIISFFLEV